MLGTFSAAALALEEDEVAININEAVQVASNAIASSLVSGRCKRRGNNVSDAQQPIKRRYIYWDRQRAKKCINDDYLGPSPLFGLDDFKRIFWVSRSFYNELRNHLCHMQLFFVMVLR